MNLRLILFMVCSLMAAIAASPVQAGLEYRVNPSENPTDYWKLPQWALKELGSNIKLKAEGDKLTISSDKSNVTAYLAGSEFSKGKLEFKGSFATSSPFYLLGHFNPASGDNIYVGIIPQERRVELARARGGKIEKLAEAAIPDSFDAKGFTLEMDFNGKQILVGVNGALLLKAEDDGSVQKGFAGIRGAFYTKVAIASLTVDDKPSSLSATLQAAQAKAQEPPLKTGEPTLDVKNLLNWDISKAWKRVDGPRLDISLNQLWEFSPVDATADGAQPAMPKEWGYFIVPGHWRDGEVANFMHLANGQRVITWNGKSVTKYTCAWYRRNINIPSEWRDRHVVLLFESINGCPCVLVNGKQVASSDLDKSSLMIDVSEQLKYGDKNDIAVFIDGKGASGLRCGIFGDTWLKTLPAVNLGEPKITTSVRRKVLSLEVNSQLPDESIELKMHDANGQVEASQVFKVNGSGLYSLPWVASKLWTPNTPNLYKAEIVLKDAAGKVLDNCERRFGFRELYVENGSFMLNGKPIILKLNTDVESVWTPGWMLNQDFERKRLQAIKLQNVNGIYAPNEASDSFFDIADELGLIAIVKGKTPWHEILDQGPAKWALPLDSELAKMANEPRMSGCHPSICGLLIDVWYNFHTGTTNPEFAGLKADAKEHLSFTPDGALETKPGGDPNLKGITNARKERLEEVAKIYSKRFPSLALFTGGSGEVNGIYATHLYHTWGAPTAEMRAFFERWKMRKDIPIFVGETTLPYIGSLYQIENFNGNNLPLFLENGARLLGQKAYSYNPVTSWRPFHEGGPGSYYANSEEQSEDGKYQFQPEIYQTLLAKSVSAIIPYWRADGLTAFAPFGYIDTAYAGQPVAQRNCAAGANLSTPGYKSESTSWGNVITPRFDVSSDALKMRPLLLAYPYRYAMADISMFIAGPSSDYYLQDHSFFGGETVEKSIVILNDTESSLKLSGSMSLLDEDGSLLLTHPLELEAAPFKASMAPLKFKLPRVAVRRNLRLSVSLNYEGGQNALSSVFDLQAFPKRQPWDGAKPYVFDPEGTLLDKLSKMNLDCTRIKNLDSLPESGVLIVGRKALKSIQKTFNPNELTERGLNVLIMEQEPQCSPELIKVRQRNAFINASAHPALNGFKDCDFSDWNGSASADKPYSNSPVHVNWSDWGARNMVASYVFRRPVHGNFLSLLVSGFDLYQTPLLEYRGENGSWIACQLDATDRLGSSPVPTQLFLQLLDYLDKRCKMKCETVWFGNDSSGQFIDKFAIKASRLNTLSSKDLAGAKTLLLFDGDFQELIRNRDAIAGFVYAGGKVLYLQRGDAFSPAWLPFTMKLASTSTRQALTTPGDWLFGWGDCELYFHEPFTLPVFEGFPRHDSASSPAVLLKHAFGNGSFIFTSVLPERFGDTPAAGKATRLLSALLTTQGVGIANTSQPFIGLSKSNELDMTDLKWEFATDPDDKGLKDGIQNGATGSLRWLKGLIADGVEVRIGQPFDSFLGKEYLGVAWYRIDTEVSASLANEKELYFIVGAIDDFDSIYINGTKIGETDRTTPHWWETMRIYKIPEGVLKPGSNAIAIRVFNEKGQGGIVKGPVKIATGVPKESRVWTTPYPGGVKRDYEYKPDIVRMY